jgi:preprotein translocase subunit YajC|tara:strand:- start:354 stop:524 length:171 start_codon:yes stop_codon:yes gene_type:complete
MKNNNNSIYIFIILLLILFIIFYYINMKKKIQEKFEIVELKNNIDKEFIKKYSSKI